MFWVTLSLLIVAVTLAGWTLAEPFGRLPGTPRPTFSHGLFSFDDDTFSETHNGR